ncbi:MAG: phosphate/phosphite/phosphonate ABC transporter substrate-binding protein [Bacteroidales bacterium]|nr:phosphate/phosphite/phosphonate ABC transporter substrate-binding protein [Bacteroidales bacterium]
MKKLLQILFCFFMLFTTTAMAQEYTIGILANRGIDSFYDRWLMHAAYLEKHTGQSFTVKPLSFTEIEPAIAAGKIDFLLTNSSMFVALKAKYHIKAIATMVNGTEYGGKISQFGGVIFTSASSNINTLTDIKGNTFIAVKKTSLGGYQMALKELMDHNIDLQNSSTNLEFANTHDNVVKEILARPGTIGTVRSNVLENLALNGTIDMRDIKILNQKKVGNFPYIVSTPLYAEWPMASLPKTDKRVVQKVNEALKQMQDNDLAADLAGIAGWESALDYSNVDTLLRSIGLLK